EAVAKGRVRTAREALEANVAARYGTLTEAEIKALVVEDKWLARLRADVAGEVERVSQALTGRVRQLADRYARPLPELEEEVGVIPEDWTLSTVGREFNVQLGKMLDAEKNVGVMKPYLGNRAVQWDRIDVSDLPMMAMSQSDMERYRLKRGDLLVCEGGEIG